jgi:hypothetical protein
MRKVSALYVHAMKVRLSIHSHPGHCMDVNDLPQAGVTILEKITHGKL